MEVGLVTLLVSLALLLALRLQRSFSYRDLLILALVMVLSLLTRTDALIPCFIITGFVLLTAHPAHRWSTGLILGGTLVCTLTTHTLFRLFYYGYPLPNTYYLKVYGFSLDTRLYWGFLQLGRLTLAHLYTPIAIAAVYLTFRYRTLRSEIFLLTTIFIGQCAYSVYVGGDAWEWMRYANRYITVGMPALLLVNVLSLEALFREGSFWSISVNRVFVILLAPILLLGILGWALRTGIGVEESRRASVIELGYRLLPHPVTTIVLLCLCVAFFLIPRLIWLQRGSLRHAAQGLVAPQLMALLLITAVNGEALLLLTVRNACHVDEDADMARYGLTIREVTAENASIAVLLAGAIPYFSHRPTVDLLGKSDYIVATTPPEPGPFVPGHNKRNDAYSIKQLKPDVVAQFGRGPELIKAYGYEQLTPGFYVRADSQLVDRTAAEEAIRNGEIPRRIRAVPLCRGEY
jgi:hypothetical protein